MIFETGATLNYATAKTVLDAGLARIESGADEVDCAQLVQFDSSALAVLLAWQRAAAKRAARLAILNMPAKLESLARAYGVETLLPVLSRH